MKKKIIFTVVALSAVLSFGNAFAASALDALTAEVASLKSTVTNQQLEIQNLQSTLNAAIAALENRVVAVEANPAVQIGTLGYMRLDTNERSGVVGPHVIFEGVNLHLQNGAGESLNQGEDAPNGLGNFIIGYDGVHEQTPLVPGDRSGSHNLVVGWSNKFSGVSSIVHGYRNTVTGRFSATISGYQNNVRDYSAIVGGSENLLQGDANVIVGGNKNFIEDSWQSVLVGGDSNYIPWNATASTITGGQNNTINGTFSTVTGGQNNNASGNWSSVSGGFGRATGGDHDWVAGSLWEDQ